jgi:hypothetical protein
MPAPTVNYGTGSFTISNVSDPATIDANLVFDSTGGGRSASPHQAPWLDELGWATDNNRVETNGEDTSTCSSGSLSVIVMDALVASDFDLIV